MSASLPSWARVGAKVVCVYDEWHDMDSLAPVSGPECDEVCTIAAVEVSGSWGVSLFLVEHPTPFSDGFLIDGFRPLVPIEEDIATHFAHLLNTRQPRKTGVDA